MLSIQEMISAVATQNPAYQNSPQEHRSELAKIFIRRKLCRSCRNKIIDKSSNEFMSLSSQVCPDCESKIKDGLKKAINPPKVSQLIIDRSVLMQKNLLKEIRSKTGKEPSEYLGYLHRRKNFTAPAIKEYLYDKYQIDITVRYLNRIMRDMGILNLHIEALRKRVVSGRMDYENREIDYSKRKINYKLRTKRREAGIPAKHKFILIRASDRLRAEVKRLAKQHKLTISETARILLNSVSESDLPQYHVTYADRLDYAIQHNASALRKEWGMIRKGRGTKIILTKRDKR